MRGMVRCNVCLQESDQPLEEATVRSNVRKFRDEQFRLWRCGHCKSVHATDAVDLAHYYRNYPFHEVGGPNGTDVLLRAMYRKQLSRLKAAGLRRDHTLLDYGCGGGAFVKFLQAEGYAHVHGWDEYSDVYSDRRLLESKYDVVLTQDVLEHVAEPWSLLHTLAGLVKPGGAVAIGTPNAEALDLHKPEEHVHTLHQPYHRHIFSKSALLSIGEKLPWTLEQYYPTMYSNTWVPFANSCFVGYYFKLCDDTLDLAVEPIQTKNPKLYTPATLFWGFFGAAFAPETDVMAVYRAQ
jgi:2-polyprenyl-3-methyl-5-hydroxy-6-metoxy-1,4-benzoquinol methylase